MLSRENDPDAALKAFGSGADDFLSTPCDPRVLAAHVLACSRRYLRAPPRVLRAGRLLIDPSHFSVTFGGRPVRLTPTVFLILEQLARQPGSVVRRQGILDQVRKFFDASLSHTLDTHICNIRRKLGPGNGRVIETVAGIGYRLNVP
jgi:DNA-binding response OmpR family regulator